MFRTDQARYLRLLVSILAVGIMAESMVVFALPRVSPEWPLWASGLLSVVLMTALALPPMGMFVVYPLWKELDEHRRAADAREVLLREESDRQHFEAQLGRALSIVEGESEVLDVTRRALLKILPATRVEMLLADSSDAHLRTALRVAPDTAGACSVESPRRCVAARRGQTLRFADSEAFDACPHLRERELGSCSAVCVPVSVMGKVVGVIHAVRPLGEPLVDPVAPQLEAISTQVGTRMGLARTVESMQVQASTDPLTGLLNRRSFEAATAPVLASGGGFVLAMADLDHFKRLNDTYGHEAGDRALKAFSQTLRSSLRAEDIVGRIGGEEFCVILPKCSVDAAARALEGVRLALATTIVRSGVPPFTVSFGVVDGDGADSLEALTSIADKALYDAKREGRDRIVIAGRGTVVPEATDRASEPVVAPEAAAH